METKKSTRERLLDAGAAILLEDEEPVDVALKASRVTRRANLTSGAFFHYWQTQQDYVKEVLDHTLEGERSRFHTFDAVAEVLQRLLQRGDSPLTDDVRKEAVLEAGQRSLEALTESPVFAAQMALWSRHLHDKDIGNRLKKHYRELDEQAEQLYGKLLEDWGVEPREPYTIERIAAILTALANGLAIRRAIDPEALPDEHEFLGNVTLALLPTMTQRVSSDTAGRQGEMP